MTVSTSQRFRAKLSELLRLTQEFNEEFGVRVSLPLLPRHAPYTHIIKLKCGHDVLVTKSRPGIALDDTGREWNLTPRRRGKHPYRVESYITLPGDLLRDPDVRPQPARLGILGAPCAAHAEDAACTAGARS